MKVVSVSKVQIFLRCLEGRHLVAKDDCKATTDAL